MTHPDVPALITAHDDVVRMIEAVPDAALDWQPTSDEWSLKQVAGHLAHANDFYIMIIDEVRANAFATTKLHPELPGFQAMISTDAAVTRCVTSAATLACFEQTYQRLLTVLDSLTVQELDQPFVLSYAWQPDVAPERTTFRQRVVHTATRHMCEHQAQMSDLLAQWTATRKVDISV